MALVEAYHEREEAVRDKYDDFDRAEEILYDYYELPALSHELIADAFKIMGEVNCLELLHSLNLTEDELQTMQQ